MKNILVIGSENSIAHEIMMSEVNNYDIYHFYDTDTFFDSSFKLHKTELFDIILVFSKLSESTLSLLKKKVGNKAKKFLYIQHIDDISVFSDTDLIIYYNCLFSNYTDNILNTFFDKIQNYLPVIINEDSSFNPISSTEVYKCILAVEKSEITSGRYFIGSDYLIAYEILYTMFLKFADIKYNLQINKYESKKFNIDSNKKFKETFNFKFTLLEKDILNTLRNRKRYPLLLGDFYNLDNIDQVIRFIDTDDKQVGLSPIDDIKTIKYYDFASLLNINRK